MYKDVCVCASLRVWVRARVSRCASVRNVAREQNYIDYTIW